MALSAVHDIYGTRSKMAARLGKLAVVASPALSALRPFAGQRKITM